MTWRSKIRMAITGFTSWGLVVLLLIVTLGDDICRTGRDTRIYRTALYRVRYHFLTEKIYLLPRRSISSIGDEVYLL